MSKVDFQTCRQDKRAARKRVSLIMSSAGAVIPSRHFREQAEDRDFSVVDALNVLKSTASKIVEEPEMEKGTWRYRIQSNKMVLVFGFTPNGEGILLVTAWWRPEGRKL